jgi:hypothetical protein
MSIFQGSSMSMIQSQWQEVRYWSSKPVMFAFDLIFSSVRMVPHDPITHLLAEYADLNVN